MTPRFGLSLVRLEESVFVLGGNTVGGLSSSSIEKFDIASGAWKKHRDSLLSTSTTGLAVTTLPSSAIGCDLGCKCGVALAKAERIIGGQQAEVTHNFAKNTVSSETFVLIGIIISVGWHPPG